MSDVNFPETPFLDLIFGTTGLAGKTPRNALHTTASTSQGLLMCYVKWAHVPVVDTQGARQN